MSISTLTTTGNACWDYLFTALQGGCNVGLVGNTPTVGAGTNPTGRLPTVLTVGRSTYPDFSALPFVGIQLAQSRVLPYSAPRTYVVEHAFDVAVVVEAEAISDQIVSLDDAMRALQAVVDDGAGNGVYPILMDRANFTLGGAAFESIVTDIAYQWDRSPIGKGASYVAYATLKYTAKTITRGN